MRMRVENKNIFSTQKLMDNIQKENHRYKRSSLYLKIGEKVKNGDITKIGKSQYVLGSRKPFQYEIEPQIAKKINRIMKDRYSSDFEYSMFEINVVLNQFLNHLITRHAIVLEVPKSFVDHVFITLKEAGIKNILSMPNRKDIFKYLEDYSIILLPLISKAPIDKKSHKITIEKLIVDLISSSTLNCFYEGAELPEIINDILSNYNVRYDTLRNYAKRRNVFDKLLELSPKTTEVIIDDNARNIHA